MKVTSILFLLLISTLSLAQNKQEADSLLNAQDWSNAAKAYKKYLKKNDADSSAWFSLGRSHLYLQEYTEALSAFSEAEQRNFSKGSVNLAKAKASILNGDKAGMYTFLENAASSGIAAYAFVKNDTSFAKHMEEEAFTEIMEKFKLNSYPCLSAENYRHFDFWLGTWDVYANGRKTGVNVISMAEGGCAIHESYTTAGNYSGQSINFYDPIDKKWHQHWVGSGGDVFNYLETDRGPGMLKFESKTMGPSGQISLSRLTFTLNEDGSVRQFFESSTDDGKTWTPSFDGLYKKQSTK